MKITDKQGRVWALLRGYSGTRQPDLTTDPKFDPSDETVRALAVVLCDVAMANGKCGCRDRTLPNTCESMASGARALLLAIGGRE